jgi:hypothetical protein
MPSSLLPLLLAAATGSAAAQTPEPPGRIFDSVALYAGQGVDLNLRELPGAVLRGDLHRESSYFVTLGLGKVWGTLGGSVEALRGSFVENVRHGYEVVLVQHHGLQDNFELGAAYLLRSPDLALGHPARQRGRRRGPVARVRHAQLRGRPGRRPRPPLPHPAADPAGGGMELGLAVAAGAGDARATIRSGAYGTIAPSGVGSNFVAGGLRYRF